MKPSLRTRIFETVKALSNLGLVAWRGARYADAERFHREALAISTRALTSDPQRIARSQVNLAMVLRDTDRFERLLLDRALLSQRETLDGTHRDVVLTLLHLGVLAACLLSASARRSV